MTKLITDIFTAKLDGFDIFLAITLGGLESYWFNGGALGAIVYQIIAIMTFKTIKVVIDRWFAKAHS